MGVRAASRGGHAGSPVVVGRTSERPVRLQRCAPLARPPGARASGRTRGRGARLMTAESATIADPISARGDAQVVRS